MSRHPHRSRPIDLDSGKLLPGPVLPPGPQVIDVPPGVKIALASDPAAVRLCIPMADGRILRFSFDQKGAEAFGVGFISSAAHHAIQQEEAKAEAERVRAELDALEADAANQDLLDEAMAATAHHNRPRVVPSTEGLTVAERYRKAAELYGNYGVPIADELVAEYQASLAAASADGGPDHPAPYPDRSPGSAVAAVE